ncbi:MAG TPA: hypothetical protein VH592_05065 [Gemmataceae bacterium]|jgi:hypothetical protein
MKCISIARPWAWAILAGLANVAYRCHGTDYRGDLLIYASSNAARWDREQRAQYGADAHSWEELPQAMVVGMVELWACAWGKYSAWVWGLCNPQFIEPVLARPGKGLYELDIRRIRVLTPVTRTRRARSQPSTQRKTARLRPSRLLRLSGASLHRSGSW